MAIITRKHLNLAVKTHAAINAAIEADQGGSYRQHLGRVLPHMGDAYRGEETGFRAHLGASVIGKECGRAIWYGFRGFKASKFGGRMLRLFNRGHLEEARFIAALLTIGVKVYQQDEHGRQFRISAFGGHFAGSGDGVCVGIPDLPPDTPCLLEFKTHSEKSFLKLVDEGVRTAKFEHYVQMQTYMRKMGLAVALYGAVNKNNDEFHFEIVTLDTATADQFHDRAHTIIFMKQAPKKINESAGWFGCRYCDYLPICHLGAVPDKNCRTCKQSEPREDGKWYCTRDSSNEIALNREAQGKGCDLYEVIAQ